MLNDNNLILQVYLLISKYIFTIEFTEKLVEILSVSSELDKTKTGKDYIKIIIEYLIKGTEKMTEKQLGEAVKSAFPEKGGDLIMTIAEKWEKRGEKRGEKKGIKKTAKTLLKMGAEMDLVKKATGLSDKELKQL